MRSKHRLLFSLVCVLIVGTSVLQAQDITRDDQLRLFAPTSSGQTGLFTTVSADTLRRGDWSFGVYYNDYDLLAGDAREFAPPSARELEDLSYDLYRLSASIGVGLTDRWEVSAMLPWDRYVANGGDRVGIINGHLFAGQFAESGLGNVKLATKIGLTPPDATSRFALLGFVDLPTGDDDLYGGATDFGVGGAWTGGRASVALAYVLKGDHDDDALNPVGDLEIPDEFRIDAGLNWPIGFWPTTNWISELNTVVYTGGDRAPDSPVFLVTGIRHWFGTSGWALSAGARWNVAKFFDNNDECRFTELDDCALSGLIGLTFAPLHLAAPAPPPPAPVPVAPSPEPAPVPPPEAPVAPPRQPQELRTDEIHFEPGSARLSNIAKAILDEVALRMKQEPSSTALVIGYTDDRENTGPNADLDRRRAEAVRDYLVTRHGIDPARITVEGRGTSDAVGDNTTAEGRLRNRRVVIRLILP
ncbi:MAG TPA: OmpA family protein [Thermoanaerobaculia bacterium]|nr:OmpA family protein [Thermoanaerobaculia bacterium]